MYHYGHAHWLADLGFVVAEADKAAYLARQTYDDMSAGAVEMRGKAAVKVVRVGDDNGRHSPHQNPRNWSQPCRPCFPAPITLPEDVPRGKNAILTQSGFVTRDGDDQPASRLALPFPAVREECIRQHGARSKNPNLNRPPPVRFPPLDLFVKFGCLVPKAEAQCLLLVQKYLPTVPVPEVYGWQYDDSQCFIYVELLEGEALEDCWDDLSEDD
ncbi:uncharacterized protein SPSK_06535 [Sporothrix schenckii 1099-18]|uniref:Protein kinase domain-containing protein n=1 Tax=Sporothrix schenckii 1099-18 TaxID=1397361 RepID=A0A0F2MIN1_SPOSC|nr:uncharacterized protein SPSK_06535 [Sporothrix schenckii 1099-18]KJR89553.1 hypothetical protein SPSK_06535 [Sporothrix schenckii 1099-18]